MKISIIIPAYNEEKYLPKLLESIKKQNYRDYEIIVADADSKDKTREIAEKFGARVVDGGLPAAGRNNGAKSAKGDLFIFFDADTILPKNFLRDCFLEFEKNNLDVAGVGLVPMSDNIFDNLIHDIYNFWQKIMQGIDPYMSGAGMFVRKKVFFELDGFDENLIVAEDHAFARKSKKRGYKFGILKRKIFLDLRRIKKEGRIVFISKLLFFLFKRFFGEIKKSRIKYELKYRERV